MKTIRPTNVDNLKIPTIIYVIISYVDFKISIDLNRSNVEIYRPTLTAIKPANIHLTCPTMLIRFFGGVK